MTPYSQMCNVCNACNALRATSLLVTLFELLRATSLLVTLSLDRCFASLSFPQKVDRLILFFLRKQTLSANHRHFPNFVDSCQIWKRRVTDALFALSYKAQNSAKCRKISFFAVFFIFLPYDLHMSKICCTFAVAKVNQ